MACFPPIFCLELEVEEISGLERNFREENSKNGSFFNFCPTESLGLEKHTGGQKY